jgi:hypothetical protein
VINNNAEELLAEWIPGVTETWVECDHNVKILTGRYATDLPMTPTGDHPECLARFVEHEELTAREYEVDLWQEYREAVDPRYAT